MSGLLVSLALVSDRASAYAGAMPRALPASGSVVAVVGSRWASVLGVSCGSSCASVSGGWRCCVIVCIPASPLWGGRVGGRYALPGHRCLPRRSLGPRSFAVVGGGVGGPSSGVVMVCSRTDPGAVHRRCPRVLAWTVHGCRGVVLVTNRRRRRRCGGSLLGQRFL